jgi:hypothetical protein
LVPAYRRSRRAFLDRLEKRDHERYIVIAEHQRFYTVCTQAQQGALAYTAAAKQHERARTRQILKRDSLTFLRRLYGLTQKFS